MGIISSLLYRLIKLFSSDKQATQNIKSEKESPENITEDNSLENPDEQVTETTEPEEEPSEDSFEEIQQGSLEKQDTENAKPDKKSPENVPENNSKESLASITRKAKIAAALPTNIVKLDNESYLITEANLGFYGKKYSPSPEVNFVQFLFQGQGQGKKKAGLFISCYFSLFQEEIPPGIYHFNKNPSSMSMDGKILLTDWKENSNYSKKKIEIVAGVFEIKKKGEVYSIKGNLKISENETLTINYEGNLRLHRHCISPNGNGLLEYEGKMYPFNTLFEINRGIKSTLIIEETDRTIAYWRNQVEILLDSETETDEMQYRLIFKIAIKEGGKVLPDKYRCFEKEYDLPAGTFVGYIMFAPNKEDEYTTLKIIEGTLIVERDENLTFNGRFTLENGIPIVISYTGKPEWHDYS